MTDTVMPNGNMLDPGMGPNKFQTFYYFGDSENANIRIEDGMMYLRPKSAGQIEIAPGVCFSVTAMPNRFHRWMNRLVFGYKYHDWQGWAN